VVITDLSMPEEGGLSLMQWSQQHCPGPAWIVLTGHGTFDTAVKALQIGAFDFLEKPLKGAEPLKNSVRNALAHQRLKADRDRLHSELQESNARLREHVQELEEAYRLLRERADSIRADLHRAGIIQRALLPQVAPRLSGFQVHALYRPSHSVGGDLYDVVRLDDRRAALLIADAAGHGLSAAMLAVLFRSQLPFIDPESRVPRPPADMLRAANRALCDGFPAPGLFLTAAYCLLDTERGTATVASAGHPPLLLFRRRGGCERIFHTGPALGLYPDADYAQQEVVLEPGDQLLFYSDGLYEWLPAGAGSPSDRIAAAFEREGRHDAEALQRLLASSQAADTPEAAPEDDVTLLVLDATPGESQLDNGTLPSLPAPAPARAGAEILFGSDARRTTLSIQGHANWAQSAAFHDQCVAALEAERDVLIDLTLCQNLDSTFLGTIHELCERAAQAQVELHLQGVTPAVQTLFEELGMKRVLERVAAQMLPLPTRMEPLITDTDPYDRALLMLHAHESLAGLSDRNRREFDPVLELLRRELAARAR
jgi:serine phosphatase RsbU (regulator of sigma subunit)/anti-anti-sigma regulatory factor